MAKYPKFTKRIKENNYRFVKRSVAFVVPAVILLTTFFITANINEKSKDAPESGVLENLDDLGSNSVQKPQGTTNKEYGKEEADNNFNSVVDALPTNKDTTLIQNLLSETISFEHTANGMPVVNTYTFDEQNGTYQLVQKAIISLPSGLVVETNKKSVNGTFVVEDGALKLFEDSGLNAGDVILGNNSQSSKQYSDIFYVAEDGEIYGTISGTAVKGVVVTNNSQQNTQQNQNTPTI